MIAIIIFLGLSIITSAMAYSTYESFEAADLYYDLYNINNTRYKLFGEGSPMKYLGTPSSTKSTILIVLTIACWICFIVSIITYYRNKNRKYESKDIICKKCGVLNSEGSKHCKNCGTELSN